MFSFSAPLWGRRNPIESHYHDKKKLRKLSKFLQTLKSCFGRSTEVDIPSRDEYQRASDPATGFEGGKVYGTRAEYLEEDDMAWGKSGRSKKQAQ